MSSRGHQSGQRFSRSSGNYSRPQQQFEITTKKPYEVNDVKEYGIAELKANTKKHLVEDYDGITEAEATQIVDPVGSASELQSALKAQVWKDGKGKDERGYIPDAPKAGLKLVKASDPARFITVSSYGQDKFGIPKGSAKASDYRPDGSLDVEGLAKREFREETGINPDDVTAQSTELVKGPWNLDVLVMKVSDEEYDRIKNEIKTKPASTHENDKIAFKKYLKYKTKYLELKKKLEK